jgi:hypothetical protein
MVDVEVYSIHSVHDAGLLSPQNPAFYDIEVFHEGLNFE